MNKEQQIEEMAKMIDKTIIEEASITTKYADYIALTFEDKDRIVQNLAEALYNAGYRKVLFDTGNGKAVDVAQYAPWELIEGYTEREVEKARKETAGKIISAMKTMIINRRADERSGLNSIYTTYSPERLFDDILDYVRIAMGVEVEK